jgi:hypothetical protein
MDWRGLQIPGNGGWAPPTLGPALTVVKVSMSV